MSKSAHLRAADIRAVYRLVGECRDLGDDPGRWRRHLLAGAARLAGAGLGIGGEVGIDAGSPRLDLGITDWGWENGFDRAGWVEALAAYRADPLYNPLMTGFIARLPRADGTCLARSEMIPDAEWYRSDYYQVFQRTIGVDATVVGFHSVGGRPGEYSEVFLARATGERDFSAREKAVVREAHAAAAALLGGPLARLAEPSPAGLSPRLRQILGCLLDGDSDKQIAARLGLSRHTVNEYVERVLRHFGVRTRAELLARWVRRGWPSGSPWTELLGS